MSQMMPTLTCLRSMNRYELSSNILQCYRLYFRMWIYIHKVVSVTLFIGVFIQAPKFCYVTI